MKTYLATVRISVPDSIQVDLEEVSIILGQMIEVAESDASATISDPDLDDVSGTAEVISESSFTVTSVVEEKLAP